MNKKSVIRNISYSFLANILSLFLGILATFLFPKFLNVAGYGYYQLYIFYTGYLIMTALGMADGVQLRIAGNEYNKLDFDDQSSLFWLSSMIQVAIYAVLLLAAAVLVPDANKRFTLICACLVGFVTHPRYYLYTLLQGVNRLKEYAHIIITERSISIVVSVIALLLGCRDFRLMIIFDVIGRILSFMLAMSFCKEIVFRRPVIDKSIVTKSISYILSGVMILFATQTSSIVIGVNRFGFERQWGIEEFGKISLAIALSNMVLRCVNSISVVMFPTLRNVEPKKLPEIYKKINAMLMTTIFIFMCLFKPGCYIIGWWLPQYAGSLKYSILLLPICIYECKYSLLINTNLKTLNKEKIIGAINAISVAVSLVTAVVSIALLKNMELAIVGILVALSVRSMIGEWFIGRLFHISVMENIVSEFILSVMFIFCMYYNSGVIYYLLYTAVVCGYMYLEKNELLAIIGKFNQISSKKPI
ncbi:MAG: oligosaccharide flippase family protein [Clostridia bacterium]|nr:oligosaccharide flippase family protein [Clostridia bacterium]